MRGQAQIPGLQTVRLTDDGMRVFPRILKPEEGAGATKPLEDRLASGVPAVDEMMGGGVPRGYSVLVAGPSGSGKTVMSNEFILEGIRRGEPGVIAVFEKRPNDYAITTPHGSALADWVKKKKLEIVYVRPLDLSIDETLTAIREAVQRVGAKRAVIDSLSGLELALAPTFKEDFRESLYRMIGALTGIGVTVMSTVELPDSFTSLQFSPHGIAFLCDAIIMQRYVELDAELKRVMSVVKVRGSGHSKELRLYEIAAGGELIVGEALSAYRGLLSGSPRKRGDTGKFGT
jgi:circadian clock protein KaiC